MVRTRAIIEREGPQTTITEDYKIYIIHENDEWVKPLVESLEELQLPYEEWYINEGSVDLNQVPPQGVFYNRMSASSHTRNHRYAVELTEQVISWLEGYGRRVINNRKALQLEVRKFEQYLGLKAKGLNTPQTFAAVGKEHILAAAKKFEGREFIGKPNRGGKGSGVQLFNNIKALEAALDSGQLTSLDGVILIQEYIKSKDAHIIRTEFVGGEFLYAVKVDTSEGFELCPADACQVNDAFCPTDKADDSANSKFEILEDYVNPDLDKYKLFLSANGMEVAAIEYIEDEKGDRYVYDVNINTNYNSQAESHIPKGTRGMWQIAIFLGDELAELNNQTVVRKIQGALQ